MPGFEGRLARYPQLFSGVGISQQDQPLDSVDIRRCWPNTGRNLASQLRPAPLCRRRKCPRTVTSRCLALISVEISCVAACSVSGLGPNGGADRGALVEASG